jgi:hypothetical protein
MKTITTVLAILISTMVYSQCNPDTIPPTFNPEPPTLIVVDDIANLVLPNIEAVDNCSEATVSSTMDIATGCSTEECYAVSWFASDTSGNFTIAFTMVEVSNPLGINEYKKESLKVYPNPSNGIFTVEGSEDYKIYNLSGKIVSEENLKSGMYIIKTETESLRLIIND